MIVPKPLAPSHAIKEKRPEASTKRTKVLRKKPSNELNRKPLIHITKPSNERAVLVRDGDAAIMPHAM